MVARTKCKNVCILENIKKHTYLEFFSRFVVSDSLSDTYSKVLHRCGLNVKF